MASTPPIADLSPFHLDLEGDRSWRGGLLRWMSPTIEHVLRFPTLNRVYRQAHAAAAAGDTRPFIERCLDILNVHIDVCAADLARIPSTGPLIVVANHPFGGLDGMILTALLRRVRPDAKVLANHLLRRIPEMREACLFVDPFGGEGATRRNVAAMAAAVRWVRRGGALGIFPSGEVAHLDVRRRCVTEPRWNEIVGRLIRQTSAAVVPVFFHGRNSAAFQLAGLIHPKLRTVMLPRELIRRRSSQVSVEIGGVIGAERLGRYATAEELIGYLRARTYLLGGRLSPEDALAMRRRVGLAHHAAPLAEAVAPEALADDVAALPLDQKLASTGDLAVWFASAPQLPQVMREIGRLREVSFRQAGEGSGNPLDLDRYDEHYLHLFLWRETRRQVVGAYRLGLTDEILPRHGLHGLYTHSLFRLRDHVLRQLGPSIELGRSFVRPEHQRDYAPLALLWRGIGLFVARQPRYRRLFGPVSISNEYHSMTRQLLIAFLRANRFVHQLTDFVRPRNPPSLRHWPELRAVLAGDAVASIEQVDELVQEIEASRRSVPVLLRQYLRLNAKVLGFNVDERFGDVLDALMVVDLTEVNRAILVRYMGKEPATGFLAHHGLTL